MPTFRSLCLTLVHSYSYLRSLALELEVLLLLCHAVSHESPWIACCSSLLCCTCSLYRHRWRILILICPLILLVYFSSLSNRLVWPLRKIVTILWILDRSTNRYWILSPIIGKVRITIRLACSLSVESYVGISWWHITHLISHDHFVSSSCYQLHIVWLPLLLHSNYFLGDHPSPCLFWLLLLHSIGCQITVGWLLLNIYSSSLLSVRGLSRVCFVLYHLCIWCWNQLLFGQSYRTCFWIRVLLGNCFVSLSLHVNYRTISFRVFYRLVHTCNMLNSRVWP